jgi:hypothetical protein
LESDLPDRQLDPEYRRRAIERIRRLTQGHLSPARAITALASDIAWVIEELNSDLAAQHGLTEVLALEANGVNPQWPILSVNGKECIGFRFEVKGDPHEALPPDVLAACHIGAVGSWGGTPDLFTLHLLRRNGTAGWRVVHPHDSDVTDCNWVAAALERVLTKIQEWEAGGYRE